MSHEPLSTGPRTLRKPPKVLVQPPINGYSSTYFWSPSKGKVQGPTYLWLVGNGGMGYNYNYYDYHSSIPY